MKILGDQCASTQTLTKREIKDLCKSITEQQPDSDVPFYLIDLNDVQEKIAKWNRNLPQVQPFFAVKCNPDPNVLKIMVENGCGFDVASKKELDQVLKYDINKENIVFANPCKPNSHIKFAAANQVNMMTFDNVNELKKIKKLHPTAQVILRIATDDSDSICQFSQKFGAARSDWLNLIATCRELNLELVGVSFHVGSGCRDVSQYSNSIQDARDIFNIGAQQGFNMNILDIGGGFPGYPASSESDEPSFEELASTINCAIKNTNFLDIPNIRIIAEPGRYMVASAYNLVTKVTTVRDNSAKGGDVRYYINDGVYGSFNNIIYDHAKPMPELLQFNTSKKEYKTCSIWGPSCDGLDQINADLYFSTLTEGDYLIWFDMGAYTTAAASEFNGMPLPRQYYFSRNYQRLRTNSVSLNKCQEIGVEC